MLRRPPRSTRTDTLSPYTTLFRSLEVLCGFLRVEGIDRAVRPVPHDAAHRRAAELNGLAELQLVKPDLVVLRVVEAFAHVDVAEEIRRNPRSEERCVGKECVSTCRSQLATDH